MEGKITNERFMRMSENYETEQKTLEHRVAELHSTISAEQESTVNVDRFLTLVRKYTDVRELNAEILREFVERIEVYKAERVCGKKVQRIRIVWNCIGEFNPSLSKDDEKTA